MRGAAGAPRCPMPPPPPPPAPRWSRVPLVSGGPPSLCSTGAQPVEAIINVLALVAVLV
jgi:hypothetical protein